MNFMPTTHRVVIVLDEYLGPGLAANTSSVLALSLGHHLGEAVLGPAIPDGSGHLHTGITNVPIPILKCADDGIRSLARDAAEMPDVLVVDVTDAAQTTKNYDEYTTLLASRQPEALKYLGVALCGPKKTVNKLTGSFGLFR